VKQYPKKDIDNSYTLDGLSTECEIYEFIEKLKEIDESRTNGTIPMGLGTMLFFGPPGTGKTAYARFLAKALYKEIHLKRPSDIFDSLVGKTEKTIADSFREAKKRRLALGF
jgi:SpoVK/Ycf46/Vps4 family AAA+-type ATPase